MQAPRVRVPPPAPNCDRLGGPVAELGRPVKLDRRIRQLPLSANDLEPVSLEVVRGGSALAERLALQYEPTKPLGQLVDGHAGSMDPGQDDRHGAARRLEVRSALRAQVG